MRKQAGRPKKTEDRDLIPLDECVQRIQDFLQLPKPWSRRTLQNKISAGEFERYGTYHQPMVDWAEVRRSLNWRRKVS